MIHLIWSIINLIIVVYFFYLLIGFILKGKRIFKPQFKGISIFIMIIGIVQIISASNSKKSTNHIAISKNYNKKDETKTKQIILEDNLTLDINLHVQYSIQQNNYIPIESYSSLTGLVMGYDWEFKSIDINNYNSNEQTEFVVNGILKWNLFGITVYNTSKTFNGKIN
ncbi:hypothetical protein ICJ85_07765 [Aestuariibaculum marinum]|uniref:Uncharacterized protein n=1 Tax=Aestuariibaculum marinum TaxID=2683592 RepID=A0A8J6U9H4_9FLAO|nr:hypothetical protein [Aestuariibaculum marinum]